MKYFFITACCIFLLSNCFDTTTNQQTEIEPTPDTYIEQGQKIAMATFTTLSSNLQKAMNEGGVLNAVEYCNIAASPLVDSLEQVHNVKIKRTSLKVRNPNNQPTKQERQQLQNYQKEFDAGKELTPQIHKLAPTTTFYAPIHVMPLCQKCHGKLGGQLIQKDYELIQSLYPSDRAINYKSGDLRGMWSITFYDSKADK